MIFTLLLSMALSAGIMKAHEKGKSQAQRKWSQAREWAYRKSAEREQRKRERSAAWERKFNDALAEGPSNPLWWGHAIGWVVGGSIAAVTAGAAGAVSGAVAGAGSGWRLGRLAGERGRDTAQEAFAAWKARNCGRGEVVELALCVKCEKWLAAGELAKVGAKQYCPDCLPATQPPKVHPCLRCGDTSAQSGHDLCVACHAAEQHRRSCPGNSNLGPAEARAKGLCEGCGGRGELVTDFGGEHKHVRCPDCHGTGRPARGTGGRESFTMRCACGSANVVNGFLCAVCLQRNRKAAQEKAEKARAEEQAEQDQEQGQDGPIRAHAERLYDQHPALEAADDQADSTEGATEGAGDTGVAALPAGDQPLASVIPISQNKNKENNSMARLEGGIEGVTGKLNQFTDLFERARGSLTATQDALEAARWSGAPIDRLEAARLKLGQVIEDLATASASVSGGGYSVRDALTAHSQVGSDESVRAE